MTTPEIVSVLPIDDLLSMEDAVAAVRSAFVSLASGEFAAPVRTSFDGGRTLVMPVFHSPTRTSATKSVRLRPGEHPSVRGVVAWISDDGELVLDAHPVTTLRTGAAVGVATDLLAPPDARRLVLVGAGEQALDQVRAVLAVRDIDHVAVVSRTIASAQALRDRLWDRFPALPVEVGTDPSRHLVSADIVCCATSAATPVLDAADLPERVHINAVGSYTLTMRELPPGAFAGADVVVDDLHAARAEAGDLMGAVDEGVLELDAVTELGARLQTGPERTPRDRTVFKSVGLAIQDWAIAHAVAARLMARGEARV